MTLPIETLIANAARLGMESQHVALACGFVPGLAPVTSLCVWCADVERSPLMRVWRLPRGGECMRCPYVGYDCLVVHPEFYAG